MSPKQGWDITNYHPFVVSPLEGVWDIVEGDSFDGNKDNLKWTLMILMPKFVTTSVFEEARNRAFNKKKNVYIKRTILETYKKRKCCVFKHIGPYDNEPESFRHMIKYLESTSYKRVEYTHREIYLSDFRKTAPEKLKTILSFEVR
jgi:hypothetical protein